MFTLYKILYDKKYFLEDFMKLNLISLSLLFALLISPLVSCSEKAKSSETQTKADTIADTSVKSTLNMDFNYDAVSECLRQKTSRSKSSNLKLPCLKTRKSEFFTVYRQFFVH